MNADGIMTMKAISSITRVLECVAFSFVSRIGATGLHRMKEKDIVFEHERGRCFGSKRAFTCARSVAPGYMCFVGIGWIVQSQSEL